MVCVVCGTLAPTGARWQLRWAGSGGRQVRTLGTSSVSPSAAALQLCKSVNRPVCWWTWAWACADIGTAGYVSASPLSSAQHSVQYSIRCHHHHHHFLVHSPPPSSITPRTKPAQNSPTYVDCCSVQLLAFHSASTSRHRPNRPARPLVSCLPSPSTDKTQQPSGIGWVSRLFRPHGSGHRPPPSCLDDEPTTMSQPAACITIHRSC